MKEISHESPHPQGCPIYTRVCLRAWPLHCGQSLPKANVGGAPELQPPWLARPLPFPCFSNGNGDLWFDGAIHEQMYPHAWERQSDLHVCGTPCRSTPPSPPVATYSSVDALRAGLDHTT